MGNIEGFMIVKPNSAAFNETSMLVYTGADWRHKCTIQNKYDILPLSLGW